MASTTPSPISLTILRRDDMLLVDVAEVGALMPSSETRVEDSFLRELAQEMQLLATFGHGQQRSASGQSSLAGSTPHKVNQNLQRLYAEHTKRWLISWRVHKGGLLPSHNQTSLRS